MFFHLDFHFYGNQLKYQNGAFVFKYGIGSRIWLILKVQGYSINCLQKQYCHIQQVFSPHHNFSIKLIQFAIEMVFWLPVLKLGLGFGSLFVFYLTHGSPIIKIFAGQVLPLDSLVQLHYFQSVCINVTEG